MQRSIQVTSPATGADLFGPHALVSHADDSDHILVLCDVRLINNSVLTVFTARYVSSCGGQTGRQASE